VKGSDCPRRGHESDDLLALRVKQLVGNCEKGSVPELRHREALKWYRSVNLRHDDVVLLAMQHYCREFLNTPRCSLGAKTLGM
jgi:hypothetical protein